MATTIHTFPRTNMAPASAMVTRVGVEIAMYVSTTRVDGTNHTSVHALASRGAG